MSSATSTVPVLRRPCSLPLPLSSSSSSPSSAPPPTTNGRKRRAGPLCRIDLSAVVAVAKELGGSDESPLSGGDQPPATTGEECPSGASPSASALLLDGLDPLKRLRLCSTSSTATTLSSSSSSDSESEWPTSPVPGPPLPGLPQLQQPNLAELEFGHSDESTSPKQAHFASGGLVIGDDLDGRYELVGDGRNCKAVNIATQAVLHCQVMKSDEFKQFAEIMARIQTASIHYSEAEFEQRRDLLLPLPLVRLARSPAKSGLVCVLLPDHHGNLHHLVEDELFGIGFSDRPQTARRTEHKMQPILKQIATLLEFCHRIGLYFRDFRLRKFVFTDAQKTSIRVNNVLDLCLVDDPASDAMAFREFIPAYVAPEILDKKNGLYGGKAADVWAFGVLMFTLLNGRYPFFEASPSPIALLRRIRAHRLSFPICKSLSESARWLLHALLHQNPAERPTAEELLHAHWFRSGAVPPEEEDGEAARKPKWPQWWNRPKHLAAATPLAVLSGRMTPQAAGRISPPAAQVPTSPERETTTQVIGIGRAPTEAEEDRRIGGRRRERWTTTEAARDDRAERGQADWSRRMWPTRDEQLMAREIVGGALIGVGGSGRGRRSGSVGETQRRLRRLLIAASGREGPRSAGREVAEEGGRAPAFVPVHSIDRDGLRWRCPFVNGTNLSLSCLCASASKAIRRLPNEEEDQQDQVVPGCGS